VQSFDEAKQRLLSAVKKCGDQEWVGLNAALGRVLAKDVYAPISVPSFNNSAMDGIAFCALDVDLTRPIKLSQTIYAGHASEVLEQGTACRIFTGAVVPCDADVVVLQENCSFAQEGYVQVVSGEVAPGQHIRQVGEDLAESELVLVQGCRLSAVHIGLLASLGVDVLSVFRTLKVAIISTGDELRSAGESLLPGQIYNSNGPMLEALLQEQGFLVESFHVRDDLADTVAIFEKAAVKFDAIISVGGVSVGDADFVRQAIERNGEVEFWKVAMKPGKPLAFGHVSAVPLMGLPGNPVSAFASFQLFALPFLQLMQGVKATEVVNGNVAVQLTAPMQPQRETFLRVSKLWHEGELMLQPYHSQGSGILSSVAFSEGFARIPKGVETVSGDRVAFIPFS